MANVQMRWQDSTPLPWPDEIARVYRAMEALDARLAESGAGMASEERLFQGPIADALTRTGQLAMIRRVAGLKIKGENDYKADIRTGQVGAEQPAPGVEF
ncbi:MAG: hypothetical protein JWN34_4501 [Bryobacterales bacterium]|nr:hypothetical protein [Bryobacterales bacterium]